MEASRIEELLTPFLPAPPASPLVQSLSSYLELLLRWNQRLNLTAVRDPERIVTRHFGESLFAASNWLPELRSLPSPPNVLDVGSGAGFPGLLIKLKAPEIRLTLLEAHGKKATFLRELVRTLGLRDVTVDNRRAENVELDRGRSAHLVCFRAVEKFESVLPVAANLVGAQGRLGLLVGSEQLSKAEKFLPNWEWDKPAAIPQSLSRVAVLARRIIVKAIAERVPRGTI